MPTNSPLFVDTSGWAEQIVQNQPTHLAILRTYRMAIAQQRPLMTTNYIMTELVALLETRARLSRADLFRFVDAIHAIPHLTMIHVDVVTHAATWDLLKARPDKIWSLVDASSFVLMTQRGISEALTTDHHFSQARFVRVPGE